MRVINDSRVTLVVGETGCGKTTQVPQYILEDAMRQRRPCRIVCTQPRRIAAMTMAERVVAERGETIGDTIGYQIRLESKYASFLVTLAFPLSCLCAIYI